MTKASQTLLSSSLEGFQTVKINGNLIVISALDTFDIGEGTDFGGDHSSETVYLYAEGLVIGGKFSFKNGVISTRLLSATSGAALSTAGADGKNIIPINNNPKKPGKAGGAGSSAGDLNVFLGTVPGSSAPLKLIASGGNGGMGQVGQNQSPGGNGGNGGNGSAVELIVGLFANTLIDQLKKIVKLNHLKQKKKALQNLLASLPGGASDWGPSWEGAIANLKKAEKSNDAFTFGQLLENAALQLQGVDAQFQSATYAAIDVAGGDYGPYGTGTPNGTIGEPGKPGSKGVVLYGAPKDLADLEFKPFFMVHPSQCARMLDRIRLQYLTLEPIKNPTGVSNLMILLLRLNGLTELFVAAEDRSALIKYYRNNELNFGAVKSVEQLRSINAQTKIYLSQLKSGQNSFGYDSNHAPLGSFLFYKNLLSQMIAAFKPIEENFHAYFEDLKTNTAILDQIRTARSQNQFLIDNAVDQLGLISSALQKTGLVIESYQTILPTLKKELDDELVNFKDQIKDHFDFNFSTLVQSLTSLAFAPESKFMALVQASNFLYQGSFKVTGLGGVPVNKAFLINQINAVEANVKSINEGFMELNNGTLQPDDPGAAKLVAEEKQYIAFFNRFKNQFGSNLRRVEKAFNRYISKVQERNNHILEYNAMVLTAVKIEQLISETKTRVSALNEEVLPHLKPDLPDLVSFVSRLFYSGRNQIMEKLSLIAQAFRFWALSDRNLIAEAYGGKAPPQIDQAVLAQAKFTILNAFSDAIENFGTNHSVFPATPSAPGLMIEVPDYQVNLLKTVGLLVIRPITVTPETTREESVFAGLANIRVSKVRVWVKGASTSNNMLQVRITQSGREQIVSTNGDVFQFSHEPIAKLFKYNLSNKTILEEANFGIQQNDGGSNQTYAAIGPFSSWHIEISASDNLQLDLSKITKITLEFHGTNYAFNP